MVAVVFLELGWSIYTRCYVLVTIFFLPTVSQSVKLWSCVLLRYAWRHHNRMVSIADYWEQCSSQLCHDQFLSSHCGRVLQEGHWVCSLWPEAKMENHSNCRGQVGTCMDVLILCCIFKKKTRRKQTEGFSYYKHSAHTDPCDTWYQVHRTTVQQNSGMWVIM